MRSLWLGLSLFSSSLFAAPEIVDPKIRILPPGTPNTAVYFTLKNDSDNALVITEVQGDFAKKFEIHNHIMKDGMMRMTKQASVEVPAKSSVTFAPGGLHVMVFGLQQPLTRLDPVTFQLITDKGEEINVVALPVSPAEEASSHSHHYHD
ncbi:copper chaperone PCu(A)C [Aestuariibacter sp. AA17]|uniref:Copper chaperone PCu(A)C n=1 Tax=Fluctibacter corallii TaxID=2984329 RepID=A0ABT3ADC5_9ALTE|nr:copper chaperone PCu(A)C [Aestuariibacter sp. AA17]MCV2886640.1 copper chaperone PCu(A)C [Aestuariibacter sp. AA17]